MSPAENVDHNVGYWYHDNSCTDISSTTLSSSTDISSTDISSTMTFPAEIEAGVMKRILYQWNLD